MLTEEGISQSFSGCSELNFLLNTLPHAHNVYPMSNNACSSTNTVNLIDVCVMFHFATFAITNFLTVLLPRKLANNLSIAMLLGCLTVRIIISEHFTIMMLLPVLIACTES